MPESSLPAVQARLEALPKSAGSRFAFIVDWARKAIDDVFDAAGVETIIAQAHALYDQYVVPIDVPWVPDVLEPLAIDRPAKQLLAAMIRGFYDLVDDEDDAQVDDPTDAPAPRTDDGGLQ